jgi:recombination protein RecR
VVEQPQDVLTIEASREYRGLYHVLGGLLSPLDGIGPDKLRISSLVQRIRNSKGDEGAGPRRPAVEEVVLATNPTVEGDTTALYIKKVLEREGVKVTRLATGIPVGGDLEYADRLTLARSFMGRMPL